MNSSLVDLSVIGLPGMAAESLFSMGLSFLCWHAWREMLTLMAVLDPKSAEAAVKRGIAAVVRDLTAVHHAAVPPPDHHLDRPGGGLVDPVVDPFAAWSGDRLAGGVCHGDARA